MPAQPIRARAAVGMTEGGTVALLGSPGAEATEPER